MIDDSFSPSTTRSFKISNTLPIFVAYVVPKNLLVLCLEKLNFLVRALPLVGCSRPIVYYIRNLKPRMVCVVWCNFICNITSSVLFGMLMPSQPVD
jgi:hypothetical protein